MSVVAQLGCRFARDVTPIHRLPPEIMADIFLYCIPPLTPCEPDKLPTFAQPYTLGQSETHPRQIRAILARVCRWWRTVLNDEPRAWRTLALDYSTPNPTNVSLWLKRSKSCPLDVYIDPEQWNIDPDDALSPISELLYNELSRIRSLFATDCFMQSFSTLPRICSDLTILPRMESLNLLSFDYCDDWKARFSFPQLRTLVLRDFEVLIDGSMQNVHHLDITEHADRSMETEEGMVTNDSWSYQLLQTVPNLVSLTWDIHIFSERLEPPVVFPFLKFLSLPSYGRYRFSTLCALECFVAPSLENLDLDLGFFTSSTGHDEVEEALKEALNVICRDGSVQLRHLTLRCSPKPVNCRAMSPHLTHLHTFTICDPRPY